MTDKLFLISFAFNLAVELLGLMIAHKFHLVWWKMLQLFPPWHFVVNNCTKICFLFWFNFSKFLLWFQLRSSKFKLYFIEWHMSTILHFHDYHFFFNLNKISKKAQHLFGCGAMRHFYVESFFLFQNVFFSGLAFFSRNFFSR